VSRRAQLVYQPLTSWPYPPTSQKPTPFSAPWSSTVDLLLREAEMLGARLVVIELDVPERAIRRDQQLRADARAASEKVRVSMTTSRGPMAWHSRLYRLPNHGALGWRENVRGIALTLEALRAVERHGAVHSAEQYQGFLALPAAGEHDPFPSADAALRWVRAQADVDGSVPARSAYRAAVRVLHPDAGGDPASWARLDEARRLLEDGGLL
jgi:hypothetical protein